MWKSYIALLNLHNSKELSQWPSHQSPYINHFQTLFLNIPLSVKDLYSPFNLHNSKALNQWPSHQSPYINHFQTLFLNIPLSMKDLYSPFNLHNSKALNQWPSHQSPYINHFQTLFLNIPLSVKDLYSPFNLHNSKALYKRFNQLCWNNQKLRETPFVLDIISRIFDFEPYILVDPSSCTLPFNFDSSIPVLWLWPLYPYSLASKHFHLYNLVDPSSCTLTLIARSLFFDFDLSILTL